MSRMKSTSNKSFIDQVCWVKMAGYWPRSFCCEIMDLDSVSVHKRAKIELGQIPAILTSHLVNNPFILNKSTGFVSKIELTGIRLRYSDEVGEK